MAAESEGSEGIIVFLLWYIFIAYSYAIGVLPVQLPVEEPPPGGPPGKGPPPPGPQKTQAPDNRSTAGPTEPEAPLK